MPHEVVEETEDSLVSCVLSGKVGIEQMLDAMAAIRECGVFRPGVRVLWDLRSGDLGEFSYDAVAKAATVSREHASRRGDGRTAFVVLGALQRGIAHQYCAVSSDLGREAGVFDDLEEARAWLLEGPVPKPAEPGG